MYIPYLNASVLFNSRNILIITDLEPDDFIFIITFIVDLIQSRMTPFLAFIVTESVKDKTVMKANFLYNFLFSVYPPAEFSISIGSSSLELCPDYSLLSKLVSGGNYHSNARWIYEMRDDFSWQDFPLIFSMAPMRDMLNAWKKQRNIFNNTVVISYGSFNIREIAKDKDTELFINTAFKKIFIFEIAASLKEYGTWNFSTYPSMLVQIHLEKYSWLLKMIAKWNQHLQTKLTSKTILYLGKTDSDLKKAVQRADQKVIGNLRVLNSLHNHPDQGVFADPAAYLAFLHFNDWSPCYFKINPKEKLSYEDANESKVFYFKYMDFQFLAAQFDTIVSRNMENLKINKI